MAQESQDTQPGKAKGKGRRKPNQRKSMTLWLLALLPMSVVVWPTMLISFLIMLPTLASYLFERETDKHCTITIGLANLCGALPVLASLWDKGHDYAAVTLLLHDGLTWILPYGLSALGIGIFMGTDSVISAYYRVTSHQKIRALRRRQKLLIDEWGEGVISADYDESEAELGDGENEDEDADPAYSLETGNRP